jgi:hypothetical protein
MIIFTMPVPASMRTPGTHQYEYLSTWDGGDETVPYAVTYDSSAPTYADVYYLRPGWIWTRLADGSTTTDINVLNPAQPGRFGLNWYLNFKDTTFINSITVSVRWETSPGIWSAWQVLPKSPTTNPCQSGGLYHYGGYFKEAWGWAN